MNVRIAASAIEEFREAVRWYEERRPGLGGAFLEAVNSALARIKEHPAIGTGSVEEGRTRRVLVTGFPYQVVYTVRPTEVFVVAVAHLRRRPGYWARRD